MIKKLLEAPQFIWGVFLYHIHDDTENENKIMKKPGRICSCKKEGILPFLHDCHCGRRRWREILRRYISNRCKFMKLTVGKSL